MSNYRFIIGPPIILDDAVEPVEPLVIYADGARVDSSMIGPTLVLYQNSATRGPQDVVRAFTPGTWSAVIREYRTWKNEAGRRAFMGTWQPGDGEPEFEWKVG